MRSGPLNPPALVFMEPQLNHLPTWDLVFCPTHLGFPGGSDSKEAAYNAGDLSSILGSERFPEEEMAMHSSILAWRIPWAEESGELQSMGSQRVRHD